MKFPCYLTHPQHGVHVAYSEDEVAKCRLNGWTPREEVAPTAPHPAPPGGTLTLPRSRKDRTQ